MGSLIHSVCNLIINRYKGAFHHPSFHRDRPEDLDQIVRHAPPTTAIKSKRQVEKIKAQATKDVDTQATKKASERRQVLSPNNNNTKMPVSKKQSRSAKHLPPKKRLFPAGDTENQGPSKPIVNGIKEQFKAVEGTRPTLAWNTY